MNQHPLIFTALLILSGCASVDPQLEHGLAETIDAQTHLMLAIEAYRVGHGAWPTSPDDLRTSKMLNDAVRFDRFENLRFEPRPDGGLYVKFDRWIRPDGSQGLVTSGWELGPP